MVLRKLFTRAKAPSGPPGSRAYAIGDVHGRLDLLEELLGLIEADNRRRPAAKTYLVLLGDLIDRGPDSAGVIERFVANPPRWARRVYLQGNHEEFFLNVLAGREQTVGNWLTYGGYECAASYGVSQGATLNATPAEIVELLRKAVPASHVEFLENMADSFRFGDYLFVHAGIRPGVLIDEQSQHDLRWIREGFLDCGDDHGVIVVHGHTIVDKVEQHPNRIALDTGAYRSGVLTAIGLEGAERWFIEARAAAPAETLGSALAG
ncbi:MAG TPA: metallophosphoesterase [Allosphingosinicella sp.]|nr:metallophosphoesterase [Allosphingosinicella sp.]